MVFVLFIVEQEFLEREEYRRSLAYAIPETVPTTLIGVWFAILYIKNKNKNKNKN